MRQFLVPLFAILLLSVCHIPCFCLPYCLLLPSVASFCCLLLPSRKGRLPWWRIWDIKKEGVGYQERRIWDIKKEGVARKKELLAFLLASVVLERVYICVHVVLERVYICVHVVLERPFAIDFPVGKALSRRRVHSDSTCACVYTCICMYMYLYVRCKQMTYSRGKTNVSLISTICTCAYIYLHVRVCKMQVDRPLLRSGMGWRWLVGSLKL